MHKALCYNLQILLWYSDFSYELNLIFRPFTIWNLNRIKSEDSNEEATSSWKNTRQSVLSMFDSHQVDQTAVERLMIQNRLYFSAADLYHPYNTYSVVYSLARQESELIYCILNKELTWELISSLHGALLILELTKWVRLALQSMTICWLPGPHCNRAPDWIMTSKMRQWQPERKKEMRGMPINWLNSRRWIYLVFV